MAEWKQLTPAKAKAHVLYGLNGWLGMFVALHLMLGIVSVLILLSVSLDPTSELLSQEYPRTIDITTAAISLLSIVIFLYCALRKLFYTAEITAAITFLTLSWTIASMYRYQSIDQMFWLEIGLELLIGLLFVWYLFCAKRPNVTFKHRTKVTA